MPILRRISAALLVLLALATATGCSRGQAAADQPLRVIAASVPHAEIIKHLQETGALGSTTVQLTEITGDLDANQLLASGDVDANFFQHVPYQESWQADHGGTELVAVASVHVEPLGLYSRKLTSLTSVPAGSTVAVPNNVTNFARTLFLLQDAGLITLDPKLAKGNVDYSQVTEKSITANPHQLRFLQVSAEQLPTTLDDAKVTLSIVNGNYALEAGLNPAKDALVLESATDNPYANVLTTTKEHADDPRVKALADALSSPELAAWITQQYKGAVIPVVKKS